MIKVGNKTLSTSIEDIITTLRAYLELNDIHFFKDIKLTGNNLMVTCPCHKNGQERKPSAGITTIASGDTPAGTFHCFTCGATYAIDELISYCLGAVDDGALGRQWLFERFIDDAVEYREDLELDLDRHKILESTSVISETELQSYRYTHPYMYKRHLTDELIDRFDIGYDKLTSCITFPVKDLQGRVRFVGRRSVKTKFFHYPKGIEKCVYGLYECLEDRAKTIYVCESMFNAMSLWSWGYKAVALLGTGSASQLDILNRIDCRAFNLCFDGDEAGDKGVKRFCNNIQKKLIYCIDIPRGKDVNDLTREEFEKLNCYLAK